MALPAAHALARSEGESALLLKHLARETFIFYGPAGMGLREVTMAACRAAGFTPCAGRKPLASRQRSAWSLSGLGFRWFPRP